MKNYTIIKYQTEIFINPDFNKYDSSSWQEKMEIKHICDDRRLRFKLGPRNFRKWYHKRHGPFLYVSRFKLHPYIEEFYLNEGKKMAKYIDYVDNYGFTALHWAIYKRNLRLFKRLAEFKPDVSKKDRFGNDAMLASFSANFFPGIQAFFHRKFYDFKTYVKKHGSLYHLPSLFELKEDYIEEKIIKVDMLKMFKYDHYLIEKVKEIYKQHSISRAC